MKAIYIPIAALLLISGCSNPKNETTVQVAEPKPEVVQVEPQTKDSEELDAVSSATSLGKDAVFNGTLILSPQHQASVTLSIDGIVKNTSLLPGKYVRKGELLATLENPEFINLQQSYLDAAAQCEFLEAEYKRQEILSKEEAASQKKFQQSKADYLSMKSRKDAAAAQLSMLGVSASSLNSKGIEPLLEVRAPISGYISNLQMNMGKHITAGEPLCEIIDKNNILIKLVAYEKDLGKIRIGKRIEFRVNGMGEDVFSGEIISVGQSVDNINRSLEVYAKVMENNELFRPGMYINARIVQK
ncbi:cobalt-zinc-cadmium efflux system membrane fusion protein [Parabacteroides sp. PF5-5]|uniref:efflux RND transporter periplasmic adaptor subunit n=1 Tax=unclassified Parabacteroides TaxID=2649774 RepID=UPI00247474C2|nr:MULTISPECIES: efflux RND transporter periplasmic adaptor subunit [unclassified Parabacteroides]MDH6303694.1 cobalt-zinc-cadmium efflux system membrane fusion protein [Parabacteroides sp. PH5-39]MDH6314311.1 cobalt-zinc-cadmium efflux system membrane fusion protein [Parabacteroides sp. PF5-13]MDH6318625.1 cobalt-zinc-cadmium efflux system membrane fusion protein [Parabacteroides sp. PH5-13]MDH6322083.1 cobalt-zinc-cadmium efflux system membrane fusion protein [Parabacteroides sp. PH5-8]MDH63